MQKSILLTTLFLASISLAQQNCVVLTNTHLFEKKEKSYSTCVKLEISADFTKALQMKKEAADTMAEVTPVSASLTDLSANQSFSVLLKARGNSVLQDPEVNFPKLHIEIAKETEVKNSIFAGHRKFRINTHISDQTTLTGLTTFGRLIGEQAPLREGLAYEIANLIGVMTPRTQPAEITYKDSNNATAVVKRALLIETDGALVKRLGGQKIDYFDEAVIAKDQVTVVAPADAALFMVVHKLLGNEDFQLKLYEQDSIETEKNRFLWNTFLVKTKDEKYLPVLYDLDLASFVTGRNSETGKSLISEAFELKTPEEAEFVQRFSKLRQKLKLNEIKAAVDQVLQKKMQIENLIKIYPVDEKGRELALSHLLRFEKLAKATLDLTITASQNIRFYSKPQLNSKQKIERTSSEDDKPFPLRPGTPIKILGEEGRFYKVAILDLHHELAAGESPIGYILKKSELALELPQSLIGYLDERDL